MLILSRKVGERIRIADDIELVVTAIQGDRIKIGIQAPTNIKVLRGELALHPPAACSRVIDAIHANHIGTCDWFSPRGVNSK